MKVQEDYFKCKGQITVFSLLVFIVVVSVLISQYKSAVYYACRTDAVDAAHLSVNGFLASYQKPLRDYYGILAVDGGFGQSVFKQDIIEEQLTRDFNDNLQSSMIKKTVGEGFLTENPVFTYFVDGDWDFFEREIFLACQEKTVVEGVDYIVEQWKKQNDQAQGEFNHKKRIAENTEVEIKETARDEIETGTVEIQDPRDLIMSIWNQGILKAACPNGFQISEKSVSMSDVSFPEASEYVETQIDLKNNSSVQNLFSKWELTLNPETHIRLLTKDLMVHSYIHDKFDHAVHGKHTLGDSEKVLKYEMEYIIGGHESDSENLKTVLWKILAIRCVFNLSYLLTSSQKDNQVMVTAAALSTAFMLPHFTEVVAFVLKLSWAFAESLSDCRTLLNGGKIPLMKNDDTWYLNWEDILQLYDEMLDGNQSQVGLDYESYLQILLAFTEKDTKYRRMTHLIEKNIRKLPEYSGFKMKNCVYGIQVSFGCELGDFGTHEFQTALSY